MRAHFYPEGGWGWLVCAAGFLALLLTTGMQLAFGLLHLYAARHLGELHLMDIGKVNQFAFITILFFRYIHKSSNTRCVRITEYFSNRNELKYSSFNRIFIAKYRNTLLGITLRNIVFIPKFVTKSLHNIEL